MNLAKSDVFDHVVQTGIKWLEKLLSKIIEIYFCPVFFKIRQP